MNNTVHRPNYIRENQIREQLQNFEEKTIKPTLIKKGIKPDVDSLYYNFFFGVSAAEVGVASVHGPLVGHQR